MKKVACITGFSGQIGSYLCELLLQEKYEVYGLKHYSSTIYPIYMQNLLIHPQLHIISGDIADTSSINNFISIYHPDLFINCAAQSNVVSSFNNSEFTMKVTGYGVINCLTAIKQYSPHTRFITLGSSLMFGNIGPPQNENSIFDPKSPYAKAKLLGYQTTQLHRYSYNLFACNAICFNSESYRRSEEYVSRKITKAAARIKYKLQDKLILGNLQALRDFSHAQDTADAIYKIITHDKPDDFVIASGKTHSIQEMVELAFKQCDLEWEKYVEIDPKYFRENKENIYCGDISKIRKQLHWTPKHNFDDLIKEMVDYDLTLAKQVSK